MSSIIHVHIYNTPNSDFLFSEGMYGMHALLAAPIGIVHFSGLPYKIDQEFIESSPEEYSNVTNTTRK